MLSLGLTFWIVSMVNDVTNVDITSSWEAVNELCFNAVIQNKCVEDIMDGWKVYLKSSQRLSTFTSTNTTILHSDVDAFFILENLSWNSQSSAGEIIRVSFEACTPQNDSLPKLTAEFQLCPKITPPKALKSIQVPVVMIHEDTSSFRASLSVTVPVTVEGEWAIYLAVSTQLSKLDATNVLCKPNQGDIFTVTNVNWREKFIADVTHILEIEGYKAVQTTTKPCIKAVFAWKEDMELNPSTMPVAPTTSQTFLHAMQQSFTLTPSPSLSELRRTTSSQILSTRTEPLHTVASLQTTYSRAFEETSATIQSSPAMHVQSLSTTTTGDIFLPHECGDVIRSAGYNHSENDCASTLTLASRLYWTNNS